MGYWVYLGGRLEKIPFQVERGVREGTKGNTEASDLRMWRVALPM